jgi:hypothetical protein
VSPYSVSFEDVIPPNRLSGTEEHDLTVSCKAEGGKPAPNVVLLIDGHTVANQTQSVQHTFNTISRSYDKKTVTCQGSKKKSNKDTLLWFIFFHTQKYKR